MSEQVQIVCQKINSKFKDLYEQIANKREIQNNETYDDRKKKSKLRVPKQHLDDFFKKLKQQCKILLILEPTILERLTASHAGSDAAAHAGAAATSGSSRAAASSGSSRAAASSGSSRAAASSGSSRAAAHARAATSPAGSGAALEVVNSTDLPDAQLEQALTEQTVFKIMLHFLQAHLNNRRQILDLDLNAKHRAELWLAKYNDNPEQQSKVQILKNQLESKKPDIIIATYKDQILFLEQQIQVVQQNIKVADELMHKKTVALMLMPDTQDATQTPTQMFDVGGTKRSATSASSTSKRQKSTAAPIEESTSESTSTSDAAQESAAIGDDEDDLAWLEGYGDDIDDIFDGMPLELCEVQRLTKQLTLRPGHRKWKFTNY